MSAAVARLQSGLDAALTFLYPAVCQICATERAAPAAGFVCPRCRLRVRHLKPPLCDRCGLPYAGDLSTPFECVNCRGMKLHFRSARSAAAAHGPVLEALHRYKYQRALWFEPFLADLLIAAAEPELRRQKWDWIVPVPLHPTKRREREFNQAERLAARLGAATGIAVNNGLLERVVPTRTQTLLTREARAANVRRAFAWRDRRRRLHGERILLVDDVFTTGATTSACARVMRTAGAGEICVWTVARGL